ncbi:MAG TPA: trehalose-6-phosphate synthase [Steroidobacteraceae bacterium]
MNRLVAVSNRISMPRKGAAPGGLAVGVLAAMQARGGLWFGWSGNIVDADPGEPDLAIRSGIAFATTDLNRTDHELHYLGFCNGALWPLFHYFVDKFQFNDAQYAAYQRVNRQFANQLLPLLRQDDLVWVHDYHLIPLAQYLREAGARQRVGFFLHVPFPQIEVLRTLPVYGDLMRALVTYDTLGFQTLRDLESFRSCVLELWGPGAIAADGSITAGGGRTVAEVIPIGVDVDAVQREAVKSQSLSTVQRMIAGLLGRKCVIGVDRLDYSKGLVQRFLAYERFLETHPGDLNRVTLLQIAPVSRGDVRSYAEIRRALEQSAGRINGRFADTDWTPIRYLTRNFPHDVLMGFLRSAQVCLVTPLRDGMNLVAKEFVAAQDPDDPGVLVLSTLAGAAHELTGALLVNPYDLSGVAHAIQQALALPLHERRQRHQRMLEVLQRNDIHAWHTRIVDGLKGGPRKGGTQPQPGRRAY